jgi:prevent-host-death family protein
LCNRGHYDNSIINTDPNNFGYYLKLAQKGEVIVIMKNGKEVARLISNSESKPMTLASIRGLFKEDVTEEQIKLGRYVKYEDMDRY